MFGNINRIGASREHKTTREEAVRKVGLHLDRLTKRYSDRANISNSGWNDGQLVTNIEFKSQETELQCLVDDANIDVKLRIPLLAVPFRGKIEDRLEIELNKILAIK